MRSADLATSAVVLLGATAVGSLLAAVLVAQATAIALGAVTARPARRARRR